MVFEMRRDMRTVYKKRRGRDSCCFSCERPAKIQQRSSKPTDEEEKKRTLLNAKVFSYKLEER